MPPKIGDTRAKPETGLEKPSIGKAPIVCGRKLFGPRTRLEIQVRRSPDTRAGPYVINERHIDTLSSVYERRARFAVRALWTLNIDRLSEKVAERTIREEIW
jgi:hypothetical protein